MQSAPSPFITFPHMPSPILLPSPYLTEGVESLPSPSSLPALPSLPLLSILPSGLLPLKTSSLKSNLLLICVKLFWLFLAPWEFCCSTVLIRIFRKRECSTVCVCGDTERKLESSHRFTGRSPRRRQGPFRVWRASQPPVIGIVVCLSAVCLSVFPQSAQTRQFPFDVILAEINIHFNNATVVQRTRTAQGRSLLTSDL